MALKIRTVRPPVVMAELNILWTSLPKVPPILAPSEAANLSLIHI